MDMNLNKGMCTDTDMGTDTLMDIGCAHVCIHFHVHVHVYVRIYIRVRVQVSNFAMLVSTDCNG
jgi:hypothetical protein